LRKNVFWNNPHRVAIRLTEHFGSEVIDNRGRLSRKKLTTVLYANPDKKALFEEKLNPVMREEVKRFLYGPMGSTFRAVEHGQLLEGDTQHLYDEIWMVTTDPDVQAGRLSSRDHLSLPEARHMIDAQWPQQQKVALSHRVIDNSGDLQQTETQVRKALNEIKHGFFKAGL
jgi:dephospho-CoA kinase